MICLLLQFEHLEHLLLKVSYHPFWRCVCFPVGDIYSLSDYDPNDLQTNRVSLPINHVTPNLMAVAVPTGRYHVIFRYRFPGILKILACVCLFVFVNGMFRLNMVEALANLIGTMRSYFWKSVTAFAVKCLRYSNSLYYEFVYLTQSVGFVEYVIASVLSCREKYNFYAISLVQHTLGRLVNKYDLIDADNSTDDLDKSYYSELYMDKEGASSDSLRNESGNDSSFRIVTTISSDNDSSFNCSDIRKSPPTPPKYSKKTYRKKHARIMKSSSSKELLTVPQSVTDLFSTSSKTTSSVGSILESLRQKFEPPNVKESPPGSGGQTSSLDRRKRISDGFLGVDAGNRTMRRNSEPKLGSDLISQGHSNLDFPSLPGPDMLIPQEDPVVHSLYDKKRLKKTNHKVDILSLIRDKNKRLGESFDQSFSPERSSSPDYSYSSPERFGSPSYGSPDSSFEYKLPLQNTRNLKSKKTLNHKTVIHYSKASPNQ